MIQRNKYHKKCTECISYALKWNLGLEFEGFWMALVGLYDTDILLVEHVLRIDIEYKLASQAL